MSTLGALIILSVVSAAPTEAPPGSVALELYVNNFEHSDQTDKDADINYDGWPDQWTRRFGSGYPKYLPIKIEPEGSAKNLCLQISLDGGAAEAYSPAREVSHMFSYELRAKLKTEGLTHDQAFYSITFLSAEGKPLETYYSQKYVVADRWTDVRIGPITPKSPLVRTARIGVHLRPEERVDLTGKAMFDDIWFARLPRMTLKASGKFNMYRDPANIEISCQVSGVRNTRPQVRFELLDVHGKRLAEQTLKLVNAPSLEGEDGDESKNEEMARQVFRNPVPWRPPIGPQQYGFYRIRASISGNANSLTRSINIALVKPIGNSTRGEFGWSFPKGEDPLPLRQLALLVSEASLNWVKFPIWFDETETSRADGIAWFAERMSSTGVNLVGVLDTPPNQPEDSLGQQTRPPVALIFGDEGVWKPLVNPVMTRLSLKMRWWQLGGDEDVSYIGFPNLDTKIQEIKRHLERFGQEIQLGFNWRWLNEQPEHEKPPWNFVSNSVDTPFTAAELTEFLNANKESKSKTKTLRWVMLAPLSRDRYNVRIRAKDLVLRMLAAKIHGADAVFVSSPFDSEKGLMTEEGSPGEMFLPWRTTASLVSGAEYHGSIQMPNGSKNHVFSKGDQAVMAVWDDSDRVERLYLGENVREIDIWGHERELPTETSEGVTRQVVKVGTTPRFLVGVNLPIALWRMSFAFDRQQLLSLFGNDQPLECKFTNHFANAVSGRMQLKAPDVWEVRPREARFDLADKENRGYPFQIRLGAYASSGKQPVRADFFLVADRQYRFSVFRSLEVGLGDIVLDVETEVDPTTGNLLVHAHLTNSTDNQARFNCLLFIEKRRRQRGRIATNGRGRTSSTFVVSNGAELIGETIFIRAQEIGGVRILNRRVKAED